MCESFKIKKAFVLFLVFLSVGLNISSQVKYGVPEARVFASKEYNSSPQVFKVVRGPEGLMWVLTSTGALIYTGNEFIHIVDGRTFRCIYFDTLQSKYYWGGDNFFGYFYKDSTGSFKERILSDSLKGNDQAFTMIRNLYVTEDYIYFVGFRKIFIFNKKDSLVKSFSVPEQIPLSFFWKDNVLLSISKKGFYKLSDTTLMPFDTTGEVKELFFTNCTVYDDTSLLFSAINKNKKILLYNPHKRKFYPFKSPVLEWAGNNLITTIDVIPGGRIFVGTDQKGMAVLNKDFSISYYLNKDNLLRSNYIISINHDKDGNIFLATIKGFVIVNDRFGVYKINYEKNDLGNIINSLIVKDSLLYGVSFSGIKRITLHNRMSEENNFKSYELTGDYLKKTQFFDIKYVRNGDVLISGVYKVFKMENDENFSVVKTDKSNGSFRFLYSSRYDPDKVFLTRLDGLTVLKKTSGEWKETATVKFNSYILQVAEYDTSRVLMFSMYNDLFLGTINRQGNINVKKLKLPLDKSYFYNLFTLNDSTFLMASKSDSLYVFYLKLNSSGKVKFKNLSYKVVFENGNNEIKDYPAFSYWTNLQRDKYYLFSSKKGKVVKTKITGNKIFVQTTFANFVNDNLFYYYPDTIHSLMWLISVENMYNAPLYGKVSVPENKCLISKVFVGEKDSLVSMFGYRDYLTLPYDENSVKFIFTTLSYFPNEEYQYSYKLENFDKEWINWTKDNYAKYTNLPPGTYTFKVKSVSNLGAIGKVAELEVTVLPPWYMTWWAYVLYVLLGVIFIVIIVRLYSYRLKRANERLEKIVRERNKELYHKNELITHSIKYAKKIQDAVLPVEDELKKVFADAFVFFRPKDIVSGDFYWFYKINKDEVIVALSDCTGHGVPGAFMSMIGISLLNEIVMDKKIYEPEKILLELHRQVKKSLQSKKDLTDTFDGMDIAVLRINFKEKQILLSSANQYIFVVKENDVDTYLGDIYSIGDPLARDKIEFSTVQLRFGGNTVVYLTSDGFLDQFGGETGGKYSVGKFVELLKQIKDEDFDKQRERLMKEFEEWKSGYGQLDDVLVVGIKLK